PLGVSVIPVALAMRNRGDTVHDVLFHGIGRKGMPYQSRSSQTIDKNVFTLSLCLKVAYYFCLNVYVRGRERQRERQRTRVCVCVCVCVWGGGGGVVWHGCVCVVGSGSA